MAVKKKTVRNGYKLPKNVKINQKRSRRASQKKRVRKTSKRQRGGNDCNPDDTKINNLKKLLDPIEGTGEQVVTVILDQLSNGNISFSYYELLRQQIVSKASEANLELCNDDNKSGHGKNRKDETLEVYLKRKQPDANTLYGIIIEKLGLKGKLNLNTSEAQLNAILTFLSVSESESFKSFWKDSE